MNTRDLPGYGDSVTWGFHQPPADDDDEGQDERLADSLADAREWLDTFEIAIRSRNVQRAEQARAFLASILKSIQAEHLQ